MSHMSGNIHVANQITYCQIASLFDEDTYKEWICLIILTKIETMSI